MFHACKMIFLWSYLLLLSTVAQSKNPVQSVVNPRADVSSRPREDNHRIAETRLRIRRWRSTVPTQTYGASAKQRSAMMRAIRIDAQGAAILENGEHNAKDAMIKRFRHEQASRTESRGIGDDKRRESSALPLSRNIESESLRLQPALDRSHGIIDGVLNGLLLGGIAVLCLILAAIVRAQFLRRSLARSITVPDIPSSPTLATSMKSIRVGAIERPDSAAELRVILEVKAGLDLKEWGKGNKKSVEDLYLEFFSKKCELKWMHDVDGNLKLHRLVRLACAKIHANIGRGPVILKNLSTNDIDTPSSYPTKRIRKRDDINQELRLLLVSELNLAEEWQANHIVHDGEETNIYRAAQAHNGNFLNLPSCLKVTIVRFRVKDAEAQEVAGRIGLPEGGEFKVGVDTSLASVPQAWMWEPLENASHDELGLGELVSDSQPSSDESDSGKDPAVSIRTK